MFNVAVKGLLFNENNKLLVLHKVDTDPLKHDLPGGGLEQGEMLDEALVREFKEEVGLEVISHEQIFTRSLFNSKKKQYIFVCYKVQTKDYNIKLSEEHDEYSWIDPHTLEKEEYNNWIYKLLIEQKVI